MFIITVLCYNILTIILPGIFIIKDDEKAKDDWIGSVGRAIVRCSSTYVSRGQTTNQGGGGNGGGQQSAAANGGYDVDSDSDYSNSSNNPYFND